MRMSYAIYQLKIILHLALANSWLIYFLFDENRVQWRSLRQPGAPPPPTKIVYAYIHLTSLQAFRCHYSRLGHVPEANSPEA